MLKDIILDLATLGGLQLGDATQQSYETFRINQAAEELYREYDLVNALRAQYFSINNEEGMVVSLPHYVGTVKAVRLAVPNLDLGVVDFRPRFQPKVWKPKNFLAWQLLGEYSLKQDIENASLLTIRFKQPLEKALTVTVTGMTNNSAEDFETLTFAIGDTEQTTTKSWVEVPTSINKSAVCMYDCDIVDVDGNILGCIPNNQIKSLYVWCAIFSPPSTVSSFAHTSPYVEVLWKYRFRPMNNLTDEFMCPGYDKAIFWKRMEHFASTSDNPEVYAKAIGYRAKAGEVVAQRILDFEGQVTDKIVNIAPSPILQAFEELEYSSYSPSNCLGNRG